MSKTQIIGGRVEFNGFRVANLIASLPASVRRDFVDWIEGRDRADYERGVQDGRQLEREFQTDDHR